MSEKDEAQAAAYAKSVNDDCLCQRTSPGAPVGEHIYSFCGCHIYEAYLAGLAKGREMERQRCAEIADKAYECAMVNGVGDEYQWHYDCDIAAAIRSGK